MLRSLHPEIVADVIRNIRGRGGAVAYDQTTGLLTINEEFTASVAIASCTKTPSGYLRWKVRFDAAVGSGHHDRAAD